MPRFFRTWLSDISNEAKRRGVQQGVLIEEAWSLYKAAQEK